jgi:uncharacterized protein YceK
MNTAVIRTAATSLAILALLILNGCATILGNNTNQVSFSSEPAGATVMIEGQNMGVTPTRFYLDTRHTYMVQFTKDGYQTATTMITHSVGAGWVVLDILFGFWPLVVDAATGNWHSLDQEHLHATLAPVARK